MDVDDAGHQREAAGVERAFCRIRGAADDGNRAVLHADVGRAADAAKRTLDAGGLALMPGIVDIHTHYDAQVTWDPTLSPSVALGVTTAVMGNCAS